MSWIAGSIAFIMIAITMTWSLFPTGPSAVESPQHPAWPAVLTPSVPLSGTPFGGTDAVGALFTTRSGKLHTHFCTASVVHSPMGNLLVTAAHCVSNYSNSSPANLAFVPGYDNGIAPYGIWTVTRIFIDSAWKSTADPDHDVAFLIVALPGRNTRIEKTTGAEHLRIGQPPTGVVQVIGYPDTTNQPVSCQNRVSVFSSSQLEFDCGNFTDGTSGGPFLMNLNPATGTGTLIGVIGGYQQGGISADVSYAATFGQNVLSLYATAISASG